jgi:threonine aldolase
MTQDIANGKHALIDLRSDTVTKPTPAMREAMARAEVGDDVYGEDPTVNKLQDRAAEMFGREAALFVPTGCMGNLLAIRGWTRPTNEVICEERAHVNLYELASMCAIAGVTPRPIPAPRGFLTWDLIDAQIREKIYYDSQTALITLENTHNMHGGTVYPLATMEDVCDKAHAEGLRVHLDGARIFNASVASGKSVAVLTKKFDSIMFCLSKGLGAPVGSMLLGSREFIDEARIGRKMLGGGMRQVGVVAAAGLIALEESPQRLHIDHDNAKHLANSLAPTAGIAIDAKAVETNIVIFDVSSTGRTAGDICALLEKSGVLAGTTGKYTVRFVTHCDVDRADIDAAVAATKEVFVRLAPHAAMA